MGTLFTLAILAGQCVSGATLDVMALPDKAEGDGVEVRGVAAGEFDAALWETKPPYFIPDVRMPLLAPREGAFRNIYAPSAVRTPDGWRVFYGAWDGVPSGNDRVYCVDTPDFLSFGQRRTIIEHGAFVHVCNVNVFRNPDGGYEMMTTCYPDAHSQNKPGYFKSPDGEIWNGSLAPYPAVQDDIIRMTGYEGYEQADINGMNVLLREPDGLVLYHCDFKKPGAVYRAIGKDGKRFQADGVVLSAPQYVNDVKVFGEDQNKRYLMGLHQNGQALWYSLSPDGVKFAPPIKFAMNLGDSDKYIVALGWVRDGERLLGCLYGAGEVGSLDQNHIFARWLQKKVVFTTEDGVPIQPAAAIGPDRQVLDVKHPVKGKFLFYAEDGEMLLGASPVMDVAPGQSYRINVVE